MSESNGERTDAPKLSRRDLLKGFGAGVAVTLAPKWLGAGERIVHAQEDEGSILDDLESRSEVPKEVAIAMVEKFYPGQPHKAVKIEDRSEEGYKQLVSQVWGDVRGHFVQMGFANAADLEAEDVFEVVLHPKLYGGNVTNDCQTAEIRLSSVEPGGDGYQQHDYVIADNVFRRGDWQAYWTVVHESAHLLQQQCSVTRGSQEDPVSNDNESSTELMTLEVFSRLVNGEENSENYLNIVKAAMLQKGVQSALVAIAEDGGMREDLERLEQLVEDDEEKKYFHEANDLLVENFEEVGDDAFDLIKRYDIYPLAVALLAVKNNEPVVFPIAVPHRALDMSGFVELAQGELGIV